MRKRNYSVATSMIAFAALSTQAYAVPMFSTQTGMDCAACHAQHIPKLNSFGRKFMVSGMTINKQAKDANQSEKIVDASVMFKSMYEQTWDKPTKTGRTKTGSDWESEDGEWNVPKTASLFVGGRVTENVGFLSNFAYKGNEEEANSVSGKIVYALPIEGGYWGISGYSQADFGPFSGMEPYNTGLYKPLRMFDQRKLANAFQIGTVGTGEAVGVQVYIDKDAVLAEDDHVFATFGLYNQGLLFNDNALGMGENILPFARVAYEKSIGDFNVMIGAFAITGGSTAGANEDTSIERETFGMDMQIEGVVYEKSVEVTLSKIFKNEVTYTGLYAGATDYLENLDNEAFSIGAEVNVLPELGLKAAYLTYDDTYEYPNAWYGGVNNRHNNYIDAQDIEYAVTVGADYSFKWYADMKLSAEYTWAKPVDLSERVWAATNVRDNYVEDYNAFVASLSINF